jgi:hypothetical protein
MMTGICANCQLKALIEIVAPFTFELASGGETVPDVFRVTQVAP